MKTQAVAEVTIEADGRVLLSSLRSKAEAELVLHPDVSIPKGGSLVLASIDTNSKTATIERLLAGPDTARASLYRIFAAHGCIPWFPPEVDAEAEAWAEAPGLDDPALEDLTHKAFITIDNTHSRDLDQALYIERAADGEDDARGAAYVVYYALADASYYIRPGSALFAEALRRASSYYLPHIAIPMLPRSLSEGLVSLNEGVLRRALIQRTTLDAEGRIVETTFSLGRIRSRRKLSYNGVQDYHDAKRAGRAHPHAGQDFTETLDLLEAVGALRVALARERDVVFYNRVSIKVDFEEKSLEFTATGDSRNDVERWNEQISLLCNMEGARVLSEARGDEAVQAIFRVHPAPPEEARRSLYNTILSLIDAHGLDPETWTWRAKRIFEGECESLADYITRLPDETALERRVKVAIERQAMYSGMPSEFSPDLGRHYGVGAESYARISSPMREIVGVFTHKELLEALGAKTHTDGDVELRDRIVEAGNRAKKLQRRITKEANKLVIDQLLHRQLDLPTQERALYKGTILGLRPSRIYVELDEPPIEVKVYTQHIERTSGEKLALSDSGAVLTGADGEPRFAVGQPVQLRVKAYDDHRNLWDFHIERCAP